MAKGTAHIGQDRYRTVIDVDGHALLADEPAALSGANAGASPYDLVLAGLGPVNTSGAGAGSPAV